jgi:hypothetical protein
VEIYDSQNQLASAQDASVVFDTTSGSFKGDLNVAIPSGNYIIKVKTDQYLRAMLSGIQTLIEGQTKQLPETTMIVGDSTNDNQINILDYNILMGCYSDLLQAASCTDENTVFADLNDDGNVNQFDYNLLLRELANQPGS